MKKLEGEDIELDSMPDLTVVDRFHTGFRAQLARQLTAKGYFHSIVTSAQILSDEENKTIVAYPLRTLEEGEHQFVLTLQDPTSNILYEPIVIPFHIVHDEWGYLKSYMLDAGSVSAIGVMIAALGAWNIRRYRKKEKKRVYDGDY